MYRQLRKFINIIDELRDVGVQEHVRLPRIAVLGGQSAGKSSVLESIVGLDFLPRGDGVVTRRPLELRLNHTQEGSTPYAIFSEEIPGKKFFKFPEVREAIEELTDKVCGKRKDIVDKPIVLNVFSPTCPDLTLIDLPGITKIAIEGQAQNIEQITRAMCHRYVSDSRTIILCVVPANADMTTSDGLQMARALDPKGIRTVGVITKVDIMDRGTNAKRMIMNQEVQLRLGYVGVKNRAQEDIINQISVKEAMEKELLFFNTHPVYSTMPPGYLGCHTLTNKLTKLLFTHIKHSLPDIVREIREKLKECETELTDLGPPMPSSQEDKKHLLWNMISELVMTYKNNIQGKYDVRRQNIQSAAPQKADLSGGAKIKKGFYSLYAEFEAFNATQEYSDMAIERAIAMHEGDSIPGFPSVDVFYYLIQPQLEKLREPALELIQDIYAQLEFLASQIVDRIFMRFPAARSQVMEYICDIIGKERDRCREIVEAVIDAEQNYLFTNDLEYKTNRQSIVPEADNENNNSGPGSGPNQQQNRGNPQQQRDQPEQKKVPNSTNVFVREIRQRIDTYFKIVLRNVRDTVPKQIGYFLVKMSQEKMQFELYQRVNANQGLIDMLGEPKSITERRETLNAIMKTMDKSLKILQRDPEITSAAGDEDPELADMLRKENNERRLNRGKEPDNSNNPMFGGGYKMGGQDPQGPRPNGPGPGMGGNPNMRPMTGGPGVSGGPSGPVGQGGNPNIRPMTGPGGPGGPGPGGPGPGGMPPGGGARPGGPGGPGPGGMPPGGGARPGGPGPGGAGSGPGGNTGNLFGNPLQQSK